MGKIMKVLQRVLLTSTVLAGFSWFQAAEAGIANRSAIEGPATPGLGQPAITLAQVVEPEQKPKQKPKPKSEAPPKKPSVAPAKPPIAAPEKKQVAPPAQLQQRPVPPSTTSKPPERPAPPRPIQAPKSPNVIPSSPGAPKATGQPPAVQLKPSAKPSAGQGTPSAPLPGAQNRPPLTPNRPGVSTPAVQQPPSAGGVAPHMQAAPSFGAPPRSASQVRPITPSVAGAGIAPLSSKGQPLQRMDQLRGERHESVEGNRTIIREPDRTIIREGKQTIIRHDETDRFRYGARDVRMERHGSDNVMTVVRPNGDQIVDTVDENGFLIRRARILPDGRQIIIIDNHPSEHRFDPKFGFGSFFVDLPPPAIRIPRDRYIVDDDRASQELIYETLIAPPVDVIERPYSLEEIRYSAPLRDRMPRIDLDTVTFDTGSWELILGELERLAIISKGLNRAIARNPREVFLIEGFTDAVGSDVDNLSLSDRRAESVAVALTQHFGVPAENLVTQGYGEQFLKIPTPGPERANRRVSVQRITPLLVGQAN